MCDADTLDRTVGERRHVVTVQLTVRPAEGAVCEVTFTKELEEQLTAEMKEAVKNGVDSSCLQGNIESRLLFPGQFYVFFKSGWKSLPKSDI